MRERETREEQTYVSERRENKRFEVPDNTFVGIGPSCDEVGHVMDISVDGLSFRYVADKEARDKELEFDLFLAGSTFYLYKVPCETVWDADTAYESHFTAHNVRLRGVRFGQLSTSQKAQLEYFIENHGKELD